MICNAPLRAVYLFMFRHFWQWAMKNNRILWPMPLAIEVRFLFLFFFVRLRCQMKLIICQYVLSISENYYRMFVRNFYLFNWNWNAQKRCRIALLLCVRRKRIRWNNVSHTIEFTRGNGEPYWLWIENEKKILHIFTFKLIRFACAITCCVRLLVIYTYSPIADGFLQNKCFRIDLLVVSAVEGRNSLNEAETKKKTRR